MKKTIINANVVLENGIIWDGVIKLDGDTITSVSKAHDAGSPEDTEIIDAGGAYVGPGFVDIHVHGIMDKSTYFDGAEAAERFLRHGTTSLLATPPYELKFDEMAEAIGAAKEAMKASKIIKGLYMEGPYINVNYGAFKHLNSWGGAIDPKQYRALVDEAGDAVKVWTIAPEREGLVPFLEYARRVNPDVVFAVGHSEATPSQIRSLGRFRPTLQTHSMCATGRQAVLKGTRDFGPDEYCFREADVFCELISDSYGAHVNAEMQQLLLHNKGIHRVVLITDSTCVSPDYSAPEHLSHITDLNFDDRGGLAGSRLTMDMACRNIMTHTNCGIAQAFLMASLNPARAIGLGDEIGSIEPGKKADLVFVNDRFDVKQVMLGGNICEF